MYSIKYIMSFINYENEITYTNDKVKDCINIIFKNNKCNEICTRMTINFYQSYGPYVYTNLCKYIHELAHAPVVSQEQQK